MRIAFTFNLKSADTEEEAEFDSRETIDGIRASLDRLGHEVQLVEVSGPPSRVVARLEAMQPDLVFNTAEGRLGRYREAFYPGLFEHLGLPFVGSDAYVCALTLDKSLTKTVLAREGIPTPRSRLVSVEHPFGDHDLAFPLFLKPNHEGSSKGITQDSVVDNEARLQERLGALLHAYPQGVLVEEYVPGRDVTVPFIAGVKPDTRGILAPAEYVFDAAVIGPRRYPIYDYVLKNELSSAVSVKVPAALSDRIAGEVARHARRVVELLGLRDFARVDFRVTDSGQVWFIEANALPSLEPGSSLYESAALAGLASADDVIAAIVESAVRRHGLRVRRRKRSVSKVLRVGFAYNEKRVIPQFDTATDIEAEYDSPKTLDAIREALRGLGHEVVDFEATVDLPMRLGAADIDVVFNIAEGIQGRNREGQVPAVLEMLDIPFSGSDSTALALCLDKGLAKRIVREAGVPTAEFLMMMSPKQRLPPGWQYPCLVKPVAEGSSKGVSRRTVATSEAELRDIVAEVITKYRQAAIVEAFLPGREFTVGLLGERRPRVLPPMEIVFLDGAEPYPLYGWEAKLEAAGKVECRVPADVDPKLRQQLDASARKVFQVLQCRDVARVDFRLDAAGQVCFIECNPLPGLTPGWSDLCLIADAAGLDYQTLVAEILAPAIRRMRSRRRELLSVTKER